MNRIKHSDAKCSKCMHCFLLRVRPPLSIVSSTRVPAACNGLRCALRRPAVVPMNPLECMHFCDMLTEALGGPGKWWGRFRSDEYRSEAAGRSD